MASVSQHTMCWRTAALLLAALLLAASPRAGIAQSIYQRGVAERMSCGATHTGLLGKLITVSPRDICSTMRAGSPSVLGCSMVDMIDHSMERVEGRCVKHQQVTPKSVSADGTPIPSPLPDRRPLPPGAFHESVTNEIMRDEGGSMYWFVTSVINMELWATCMRNKSYNVQWRVPEGWILLSTQYTPEGKGQVALPMSLVLKRKDNSHLAIIVRGTRTALEWKEDLTYLQIKDPSYPGSLSKGFVQASNYLWPGIQAALQEHVVKGSAKAVTLAGHSLGSAIGTLLAYRAQVYLDEQLAAVKKGPVVVGTLLFAPPNVGDDTFVAAFNKRVNARRIAFEYDIVPQVPCAPRMMACRNSPDATYAPGVSSWQYGVIGGHITITAAGMPVQPEAFQQLGQVNVCQLLPWAVASHVCSYACFFSQMADDAVRGRCKMWGDRSADGFGDDPSFCPGMPLHDPEFPLRERSKLLYGGRRLAL